MTSLSHYNLVHKIIPMPEAMKIPDAKAAVEKKCEKLEKNPTWQLTKVRNKKEVIKEIRAEKFHFASLMDLCHHKNSELEPQHQKIQRQSCAPRWHCARWFRIIRQYLLNCYRLHPKMTAAEVMDIKSRLPGCAGQAADAVSAYTQVKMEDAPKLLKIPKSE